MPLIRVSRFSGREPAQKAELVRRLTETYLDVCGMPGQSAQGVWVVLDEVPAGNWGVGGEIRDR